METLYENHYTRTNSIIKEYMHRTRLLSPMSVALYLLALYWTANSVILWFSFNQFYPNYLIYSAVALTVHFLLHFWSVWSALRRERKQNGGMPLQMHMAATDTHLTVQSGDFSTQMPYSSFKRACQTKNLVIVYTRGRVGWIFPKESFTTGDYLEFLFYLQAKGLKVRI